MTEIMSKCGKYAVSLIQTDRAGTIMAVAELVSSRPNHETMSYRDYWFTVGHYKSLDAAIRWATKKLAAHNIELAV